MQNTPKVHSVQVQHQLVASIYTRSLGSGSSINTSWDFYIDIERITEVLYGLLKFKTNNKLTWPESYLLTVAHAFQSLLITCKLTVLSDGLFHCILVSVKNWRWVKGQTFWLVYFLFLRVLYRFIDFCLGSFLFLHLLASDTPSLKCRIINKLGCN